MGIDDLHLSRRSLLEVGGGIAALVVVADPALLAAATSGPKRAPNISNVRYVVTDRRHAQSLSFAQAYIARGSQALEVADGLTRMWQQSLLPLWQQRGSAVVGLTTRSVWHGLAEQARSQSHRTLALEPLTANDSHPDNLVSWIIA